MAVTTYDNRPRAGRHRRTPRTRALRPPGRPPAAILVAHLLVWGGAAAVLGLWWADTPSVLGAAGWLTGAGRITGLLAGYACAVLVALMARVPAVDHALGTDRLARWHAMGGRFTVGLTLAHVFSIVSGYALTGHTGLVRQGTDVVLHYPDMLKATAGFLLFLVTAGVSARAARKRMSYELWHLLHLATYAAVFLAFGHQLANGADFAGRLPAQIVWYVLYLGVAALVLWYRVLAPVRSALRHRLRVAHVREEAPGVTSVYVTGRRLDELAAQPGQFFRWRFLSRGLWWSAGPYSLSAPADGKGLRITVKEVGGHSAAVARLAPGTRVWAEGPYGGLTPARAKSGRSLLLAGGIGITPLRALFETLPGEVALVYWAHRQHDLALRSELDAIAGRRGGRVHYSVSGPAGHTLPMDAGTLSRLVPDIAERDVYVCGPAGMAETAKRAVREAGVPGARIHHESFAF